MTTDDSNQASPQRGGMIRERGTRRVVILAVALAAVWYVYNTVAVYRMQQVRWPALTPVPEGLTVLGLQDKDKPGRPRKYVAIEANHAWQVRRPDDAPMPEDDGSESEEQESYKPSAAVSSRMSAGQLVPLEEILKECPTVLTGKHFAGATVTDSYEPFRDKTYYRIDVRLTPEGRSRYWQFSRDHDGERLVFVLKGEIMTCPRMSHMDTSSLTIEPIWVKEDADRLAAALGGVQ